MQLSDNEAQTLQLALDKYGIENQTLMLFEEMAELQDAVCKLRRYRATKSDVITEIADTIIMCLQMALYFGSDNVESEIHRKILRLASRMKSET